MFTILMLDMINITFGWHTKRFLVFDFITFRYLNKSTAINQTFRPLKMDNTEIISSDDSNSPNTKDLSKRVVEDLGCVLSSGEFSDFEIVTPTKTFNAHSFILKGIKGLSTLLFERMVKNAYFQLEAHTLELSSKTIGKSTLKAKFQLVIPVMSSP